MKDGPDIARIANLIGDPARANMLSALMSGKALTASELAAEAGITPQTASAHLGKLEQGGLLSPRKQGRHKYFTLASDDIAHVIEALMGLAANTGHLRTRTGPRNIELREARVCYNHLAGAMGIRLYESMKAQGYLHEDGPEITLTTSGAQFALSFGVDLEALRRKRSPLCRPCLDWSKRRPHLAGNLGRALLTQIETKGWVRRKPGSRIITFTDAGRRTFDEVFG